MSYSEFLETKSQFDTDVGFEPTWVPDFLFDFQRELVSWAVRKGRGLILADCGLGKTPIQLVWAENVIRKTNKPVLILAPLAVGPQTVREGEKFAIECSRSLDGKVQPNITVTNYERLHYFDPDDYAGVVCDESSAIKHFSGSRQREVTEFMRTIPYRLLCTATAAPNDYIELGTSSEALGQLGRMDMLSTFFKNDENSNHPIWWGARWRFKQHAELMFWRWVCSWTRAARSPSDLGFANGAFELPPLSVSETVVKASRPLDGMLFQLPAISLDEQRQERRQTITERCAKAAEMVDHDRPAVIWCHLNDEADLIERLVPDAKQVAGRHTDEEKEETFLAFSGGDLRVLVTKPKIGAFGLNWQHCAHEVFFPSHSFEQYYQGVRRCWRFGQENPVHVDIITTEGELGVLKNLQRKAEAADKMFDRIVAEMYNATHIDRSTARPDVTTEVPAWLK